MTTIGKCLVVAMTILALAFLGFVSVSMVGGPDFQAHLDDETLQGYAFTSEVDEVSGKVKWSASARRPRPTVEQGRVTGYEEVSIEADTPLLASAIVKARKDLKQQQDEQIAALEQRIDGHTDAQGRKIPGLRQQIDHARALQQADLKAMEARLDELNQVLEAAHEEVNRLSRELIRASEEVVRKRGEARRRREEVDRVQHQIKEVQADIYRLTEQRKTLEDTLVRRRGIADRLERRRQQLLEQREKGYDDAPEAKGVASVR